RDFFDGDFPVLILERIRALARHPRDESRELRGILGRAMAEDERSSILECESPGIEAGHRSRMYDLTAAESTRHPQRERGALLGAEFPKIVSTPSSQGKHSTRSIRTRCGSRER